MDLNCHGKRRSFSPNFVAEKTRTLANLECETNATPEAKTVYVVSQPSWTSLNKQSPTLCINLCHVCHRSLLPFTHFFNKFHDHQVLFKFSKHGSWVSQDTWQQNQGYDLPPPESVGTQFVAKEYAKIGHSKGRYLATKKASLSYTTRFSPENLLSVGPTKTKSGAMVL